jgi:hypothetical protein
MGCGCGGKSGYETQAEKTLDCGCGCAGLRKSDVLKGKVSFQSALLFFLIANPATFQVMRGILGSWVASDGGCPTGPGLVLHAIVYGLVTFLIMKLSLPTPY